MGITNEQRTAIKRDLSAKFANAAGTSRMEHGVSQWEILVDALINSIELIMAVRAEKPVELKRDDTP
jgi:hypothetical protein